VQTRAESSIEAGPAAAKAGKHKLSRQSQDRIITFISPLVLLVLWEISVRLGLLDARFFPAPTSIVSTFISLVQSGELLINTWISLQRLFFGFLLGGIPALVLGIVMGLYRPIRAAIDPLIAATYPIPKSAILPLILLIFGLGEASKIVMVAIGVFFPVVINTVAGVLEIDRIYHDVSKNFGASRWQVFLTVALPGAMPLIMTGIKLGVGMGLILIAIAEMVGAESGLGFMIWNAWQTFSVETMYVGLVVIAILGFLFSVVLNELERFIIPWKRDQQV
jgi:NitT/TauT family transport system permease protein